MATQSNPMPNGGSIANSVFFVFCMQHVFGWTKEGDEEGAGVGVEKRKQKLKKKEKRIS